MVYKRGLQIFDTSLHQHTWIKSRIYLLGILASGLVINFFCWVANPWNQHIFVIKHCHSAFVLVDKLFLSKDCIKSVTLQESLFLIRWSDLVEWKVTLDAYLSAISTLRFSKVHPEVPKTPAPPKLVYMWKHFSMFQKKHPGLTMTQIRKMAFKTYDKLPDEEKVGSLWEVDLWRNTYWSQWRVS